MSAIHVIFLGSSSANEFGLSPGEGSPSLLRAHLQSVRSSHCRVTIMASNGVGLIEQCPTGYTVPSTLSGIVTVNTTLNITAALARRPDVLIMWQPAANMPEYEDNVGFTTVGQYEAVVDSEMIPAMQAIQTACLNQNVAFYTIGSHTMTSVGKVNNTDAQVTGRHYWDLRMAEVFGSSYIDGGWNAYSVGTAYNNPTEEMAAGSYMDVATGAHFTAATSVLFTDAYLKTLGLETFRDRRNALDIVP